MSLRAELVGASPQVPGFALVLPDAFDPLPPAALALAMPAAEELLASIGVAHA